MISLGGIVVSESIRTGGYDLDDAIVDLVKPQPAAKWVVLYSLGDGPD